MVFRLEFELNLYLFCDGLNEEIFGLFDFHACKYCSCSCCPCCSTPSLHSRLEMETVMSSMSKFSTEAQCALMFLCAKAFPHTTFLKIHHITHLSVYLVDIHIIPECTLKRWWVSVEVVFRLQQVVLQLPGFGIICVWPLTQPEPPLLLAFLFFIYLFFCV